MKPAQIKDSISSWLDEQTWFQQIKAKWDELDAQSRLNLQIAGLGISVLGTGFILMSFAWKVHATYTDMRSKSEILALLQSANDELRTLRESGSSTLTVPSPGSPTLEPWGSFLENAAAGVGIPKNSISISDPKSGAATDLAKETLYDVTIKKISIRQAVRYAQTLENGSRPVKLRNLLIDTQPDGSGYLDVTYSVSAFALLPKP